MLYREETHYAKVRGTTDAAPPHSDDFVECLRNALKIMETRYASSSTKEQSYGSNKGDE